MIPTGDTHEDICKRLVLLRKAITGADWGDQGRFAADTGITAAEWCNIEKGKSISRPRASLLRNRWGISLDWIYHGDERAISFELRQKLEDASRKAA